MRIVRPRITVRWLMVLVAVVALAFPVVRMVRFYRNHSQTALMHGEWEKYHELELKNLAFTVFDPSVPTVRREQLLKDSMTRARTRRNYHALMRQKYERAATHPWDVLEADPPDP